MPPVASSSSSAHARGPYARLTCQQCRKKKQKCSLPVGTTPSPHPLPAGHRCDRCVAGGLVCVPWRGQESAASANAAGGSGTQTPRQIADDLARIAPRASNGATSSSAASSSSAALNPPEPGRPLSLINTHVTDLLPGMCSFLLQHDKFGSDALGVPEGEMTSLHDMAGGVYPPGIDKSVEQLRLFHPHISKFTTVYEEWQDQILSRDAYGRRLTSKPHLSSQLLLATLLWLAYQRMGGTSLIYEESLIAIIRETAEQLCTVPSLADKGYAPQAFELLFAYFPLALRRSPRDEAGLAGEARRRPLVLGSEMLRTAYRLAPTGTDPDCRDFWCTLASITLPSSIDNVPRQVPSSVTPFQELGWACIINRTNLMRSAIDQEKEAKFLNDDHADQPERFARNLQECFETFKDRVWDLQGDLTDELEAAQLDWRDGAPPSGEVKRMLHAQFEQLCLCVSVNFATYVGCLALRAAGSWRGRMTAGTFSRERARRVIAVDDEALSWVKELLATLSSHIDQWVSRALTLSNLLTDCANLQWCIPKVERALMLSSLTRLTLQRVGGLILFASESDPHSDSSQSAEETRAFLDSLVILLESAANATLKGAEIVGGDFAQQQREEWIEWAIKEGDVLVTAGVMALRGVEVLKGWRAKMYDARWGEGSGEGLEKWCRLDGFEEGEVLRLLTGGEGGAGAAAIGKEELKDLLFLAAQGGVEAE